jgi:hypothetical protein
MTVSAKRSYDDIENSIKGSHGFYIASSDQDMLLRVSSIVDRCGYVGLMDTAGKVHYMVDGRRGSPYAAKRIREVAGRLLSNDQSVLQENLDRIICSVDTVLNREQVPQHLKGYRYLRFMLHQTAADPSLLSPVTKTLYPETAKHFRVKPAHIERDIRYAVKSSKDSLAEYSNTVAICHLHDLVCINMRYLESEYVESQMLKT